MRAILLSSASVLGLASQVSAVQWPDAAAVRKEIRYFLGNLDQVQNLNQTLDTKLKIKTTNLALITSLVFTDLEAPEQDGNTCKYAKKGTHETAVQFTIKKQLFLIQGQVSTAII